MLAAIAIHESGIANVGQLNGQGVGVFQIDLGQNPSVTYTQVSDTKFAAVWAGNLLATDRAALAAKYPNLTSAQLQQATTASYNFGTGNISGNPSTIDAGTTGNNYGSDVVDLMDCFH